MTGAAPSAGPDDAPDLVKKDPTRRGTTDLDRLEHAVGSADHDAAFALAVASWRRRRNPRLADVACALGARLEPLASLSRARKETFQPAWLALAATSDPRALNPLLATLTTACPIAVARSIRRFPAWRARMEALTAFDDDPRMTEALVGVLRESRFAGTDVPTAAFIYEPVILLLERLEDVRCVAALRALVDDPVSKTANVRAYFAERLPAAIAAITASKPSASDPAHEARVEALARRVTAPPRGPVASPNATAASEAALVDAVVAATVAADEDAGPWEVLADGWMERGDPRGERVSLELARERGRLNAEGSERLTHLNRREKEWLDPAFARLTKNRWYRRGMLDSLDLLPSSAATTEIWKAAMTSPDLATVRHIGQGAANEALHGAFLTSRAARSVSEVALKSLALLEKVAAEDALARRLVHLEIHQVPTDAWLALVTRDRFPALRRFSIVPRKSVDVEALLALLGRWRARPDLAEVILADWEAHAFVSAHDRLGIPCLVVSRPWFGGFALREMEPRVAVRRSLADGGPRLALEVCLTASEDDVLALVEAVGKTHRLDDVRIVGEADEAAAASLRRVRAALGRAPARRARV